MTNPLGLTTLITGLIFLLLFILMKNQKESPITALIVGGVFYFIVSVVQLVILLVINLLESGFRLGLYSNLNSYEVAIKEYRTILFWYLFFGTFLGEIIRYLGSYSSNFMPKEIRSFSLFGVGWGIGEFSTRFSGFFSAGSSVEYFMLFLIILILNIFLSVIMIRTTENTKFIMFTTFTKWFFEMALFGSLGYGNSIIESFYVLWLIVSMIALLIIISLSVRNYEFEE